MTSGWLFGPVPDHAEPVGLREGTRTTPMQQECKRRSAATVRVLERLKRGPATNIELCDPAVGGMRAIGARLWELRKDGWIVEREHVEGGTWRYTLKGLK